MFESLTKNLNKILSKLTGKGYLSQEDIDNTLREIRITLLEADVSLVATKDIVYRIKTRITDDSLMKSLTAGQKIMEIIKEELTDFLGKFEDLKIKNKSIILMVALQGSGKTTTTAKLAFKLKKKHKILLVSTDIHRPAAQLQLEILAKQLNIDSLEIIENEKPIDICKRAMNNFSNYDLMIVDTAGRTHIDEVLMDQLKKIKNLLLPLETLLVVDSMLGQEAAKIGEQFQKEVGITGIILTRMDGDSKGGAALSMRMATNSPIKFIGTGEKTSDLDIFYPDRMVSRILEGSDIMSFLEKAQENIDPQEVEKITKKFSKGDFDMNDLLKQMSNIKKMGSLSKLLQLIPGLNGFKIDEKVFTQKEAIINSMTIKERKNPKILNASRKKRISSGSGTKVEDVNDLLKQYQTMKSIMSQNQFTSLLDKIFKG